jgi:hypothetical protein
MGEKEEVSQGDLVIVKRAMRWARWWIPILATLIPSCMIVGQSCGVSALKTTIQQESAKALNKQVVDAIRGAVREVVREEIRSLERRVDRLEERQSKP